MSDYNRDDWNRAPFNRKTVATPNKPYIPLPSLPPVEKFPLRIYDSSFNLVAELDDYTAGTWTRRWRSTGEFEFYVPIDSTNVAYLDEGYWLAMYRGGEYRIGRIERMNISITDPNEEPQWVVGGYDAKGIFTKRIALANTGLNEGYDTSSNSPAETVCRYYINDNMITALDPSGNADSSRNMSFVELETDGGLGGNVSYSARCEVIHDIVESILLASPNGLGYECVFDEDNKKIRPHFKVGSDLSSTVKFSAGMGNLGELEYTFDQMQAKNTGYVGDGGEDAARTYTTVYASTAVTGIDRWETFIDGSDCSGNTELTQRGTEELGSLSADEEATFSPIRDNMFGYMTRDASGNWDLGDIVTLNYGGIVDAQARIIEIVENYGVEGVGEQIEPTIGGKATNDLKKMIRLLNKRISVRSRA